MTSQLVLHVLLVLLSTGGVQGQEDSYDVKGPSVDQLLINKFGFTIIRNTTVPCKSINNNDRQKYRFHPLTDDDKLSILEMKGGKFIKEYMAKDLKTAQETFPSLLNVDYNYVDKKLDPKWKPNWKGDDKKQPPLKASLLHLVREATTGKPKENTEKGVPPKEEDTVKAGNPSVTPFQERPFVLPEEIGLPRTIKDSELATSNLEMCVPRGTKTQENTHLYMCTTCSATTNLGDNYWPAIINEAQCLEADPFCFIVDDIPHGICKQKIIPMQLLKKKDGYCALGLKNGELVIVDEWFTIDRAVRMGCECVININSQFARYVGFFTMN